MCRGFPLREARAGRPGGLAAALAALAVAGAAACTRGPPAPPLPEVPLYAGVGDPAAGVLSDALARRGVARVRRVAAPGEADVVWTGDPADVVDAGAEVAAGAAPELPDVDAAWRDAQGRWAPLCARARVLLTRPRSGDAAPPPAANLRDLADRRLAGAFALAPPSEPASATALAALATVHGDASVARFLDALARNRPVIARSDDDVRALVARGAVAVGLAGTEQGAAGALSAAGLQVVYPDQTGRGAVVAPTAVALARRAVSAGGARAAAARAAAAFLVSADAERLLVARVPGFMPLRADVPVPEGVRPAGNVLALPLDWDRVAAERRRLLPALRAWTPR